MIIIANTPLWTSPHFDQKFSPEFRTLAMHCLSSKLLYPDQALSLKLKQGLVRGQADIVTALGG